MKALKKSILNSICRSGYLLYEKSFFARNFQRKADFNPLEQLFYKHLHKDFFFLQIGANDGVRFDPIYHLVTKEHVQGIVLEPLPDIFLELTANYKNYPNVLPLNKAIHTTEKTMKLYRVDPSKSYPEWTKGTASFKKEHHQLGNIPLCDILEETVPCLSVQDLLGEYKIKHIDLLQIDTEGYDYEILKMFNFDVIAPSIISFEHGMQSGITTMEEFTEIQDVLFRNRYNLLIGENDAIAYR